MTNDEIKKLFKNRFEVEYIPNKNGKKIPNENNQFGSQFSLEEIRQAETSSLVKLLKMPEIIFRHEHLNKRICEMENRVEKLEKIIRNKE